VVWPRLLRSEDGLRADAHAGSRRRCQPHTPLWNARQGQLQGPLAYRSGPRSRPLQPHRRQLGPDGRRRDRARHHRDRPLRHSRRRHDAGGSLAG
jgi:hypothetical protein